MGKIEISSDYMMGQKISFYIGFFEEVEAVIHTVGKYSSGETKYNVVDSLGFTYSVPHSRVLKAK